MSDLHDWENEDFSNREHLDEFWLTEFSEKSTILEYNALSRNDRLWCNLSLPVQESSGYKLVENTEAFTGFSIEFDDGHQNSAHEHEHVNINTCFTFKALRNEC